MLTWLQTVFVVSGLLGLGLLFVSARWKPRFTRDGVIFLLAVALFVRGIFEGRPDLVYAAGATFGLVPIVRGTVDKVRDVTRREGV